MVVKELILPKSLLPGVVRVNEGTLKVGRFSNFALSFLNKGSMTLGQWAHQKHSFQNQKGGELTVTEGSDVDLDSALITADGSP